MNEFFQNLVVIVAVGVVVSPFLIVLISLLDTLVYDIREWFRTR